VRTTWPYLVLAVLCLIIYVPGQKDLPVTDRDEGRFVQATRQMLESRDWIVVRFQDQLRAKKPAGIYWLQSASVSLLSSPSSIRAWPYRVPSLLAAIGAVLITFALAQALFSQRIAFIAALALASSLLSGVEAHLATTDAALAAFTLIAQACLGLIYVRHRSGLRPPGWCWLTFWLAVGTAILIKGPIAPLICCLTMATLSIVDRDARWLQQTRPLIGLALLLIVTVPWFVAVTRATHGMFLTRALHEDLLPKLVGSHEGHGAPPGYFALILTISMWPASYLLWPAIGRAARRCAEPAVRFLLAWAIPSWVAFELIPTKLPHYTLPLHPAFAILIALALNEFIQDSTTLRFATLTRAWVSFWSLCSLGILAAFVWLPMRFGQGLSMAASLGAIATLITIASAWWFVARPKHAASLVTLAAGSLAQIILIGSLLPTLSDLWISERVAHAIRQLGSHNTILAAGYYEPSLVFLLEGRTRLLGGAAAAQVYAQNRNAVAIIEQHELARFIGTLARDAAGERDVIDGFNYSQGKRVRLHVFASR
jgi:4-amino-4-deoxy-L-arabinose transferase-like glycosyltransferase